VTPADVGARVTLRSRLAHDRGTADHPGPGAGPGTGPTLTDTVGLLLAYEQGTLVVERRDGSTTTVAATDLVAAKVLPASPAPRDAGRTHHLQKDSP
jgi:N-acetylglutamate synthase